MFSSLPKIFGLGTQASGAPPKTSIDVTPEAEIFPDAFEPSPINPNTTMPAALPPAERHHNQVKDSYARTVGLEQFLTYSVGGVLEGIGKFYQRTCQEPEKFQPYLTNPFARVMSDTLLTENMRQYLNSEDMAKTMAPLLGECGMFVGNLVKVMAGFWANRRYSALGKASQDNAILKKASDFNSLRNKLYITEKAAFTGGGLLAGAATLLSSHSGLDWLCQKATLFCGTDATEALPQIYDTASVASAAGAVGAMLLAQVAVLGASVASWKGNGDLIRKYLQNPSDLAVAREATKVTGLNLTKGTWAIATLGLFLYMSAVPEAMRHDELLEHLHIKNTPENKNLGDFYDLLVQSSWELPDYFIWTGFLLLVLPNLIMLGLDFKQIYQGGNKTPDPSNEITDRTYHSLGAVIDTLYIFGGYFTASLALQPVGAMLNGLGGALGSAQLWYKNKLNKTG